MARIGSRKSKKSVEATVKDAVNALCVNGSSSAGLVQVSWYSSFDENDKPTTYIVAETQLATFMAALLKLHYEPGVNPHNGGKAAEALCITAAKLQTSGPYWRSVPDLQNNGDPNGAIIFDWEMSPTILWVRPGVELPEVFSMHRGYTGERARFPH